MRPRTEFQYQQPSDFFEGKLNPINTRILKQALSIDTRLYDQSKSNTEYILSLPNKNINEIKLEDVKEYLNENKMVREINKELSIRIGPKGDYIFYKPIKAKKPKFFDIKHFQSETNEEYQTCNTCILLKWIKDKYKI